MSRLRTAPVSIRQWSPAQKLAAMARLRQLAWALKRAGIRLLHPDWDTATVEAEVRKIFRYART